MQHGLKMRFQEWSWPLLRIWVPFISVQIASPFLSLVQLCKLRPLTCVWLWVTIDFHIKPFMEPFILSAALIINTNWLWDPHRAFTGRVSTTRATGPPPRAWPVLSRSCSIHVQPWWEKTICLILDQMHLCSKICVLLLFLTKILVLFQRLSWQNNFSLKLYWAFSVPYVWVSPNLSQARR